MAKRSQQLPGEEVFEVGQQVRTTIDHAPPANIPTGSVGEVVEVLSDGVRVRFGRKLLVLDRSAIEAV